jgi:hypothetical protein
MPESLPNSGSKGREMNAHGGPKMQGACCEECIVRNLLVKRVLDSALSTL